MARFRTLLNRVLKLESLINATASLEDIAIHLRNRTVSNNIYINNKLSLVRRFFDEIIYYNKLPTKSYTVIVNDIVVDDDFVEKTRAEIMEKIILPNTESSEAMYDFQRRNK